MAKRYFNVDGIGQVEVENMDEFRRWMNDNGVASGNVREFRKYEDDSSVYEVELWAEKDFTKANPNLRPFGEKNNYANADKAKIEANLRKKGLIPGGRHSDAEPPKAQAAEPYMGGMVQPQVNKKTGKIEYKPYNRDLTKEWVAEESTPEKQEYRQKVQEIGAEQDFLESSGAKKYIDERERLIDELEKMEFGAPPPDQPDAWTMWADRQRNMVERVEYLSKTAIPYRLTGMTEDERRQAAMFEDIGRNMPLLGATLLSLGHGAMGLVYKGANLIIGTPLGIGLEAIGVDTQGAFSPDNYIIKTLNARQAGLQAGLRDSGTFWNDLGTGFHSLPMSAAIMGEIALTGQAGLSTALTQGMITSDKYTEYMDDGRISQQEAWAGALSGAVQTVIEVAFDASDVKALKSAFAAGGRPALAAASRKMINETLWPSVKTYLKTQGSVTFHEISEEIAQETSDILIDHTLLGTPIPSSEELAERYRAAAFGAFYGSLLLGGLGGAITLQQSRVQQAQLKNLAENNWDSAKYLIEAHNQFNAGDIAAAEKSLNKALESAIEEGNADNRTIARGLANIKDAINTSKTHTALANNIEVGNLVREVGQLQEEAEKIGTAKTEQQYDRLSEIQTAIEQRQAKIAELEQVVNQDKETSEIYNLLKQASEAEQKARKAGDKAVKKLLKTKEYNEATPEQQRQMMKDAVLSDKKSAKLQEKADQKYREANLYKLRQTPAYKQAAPEVQTQMEEAELQRQQEAIAAEFEAARQKAISEQQEAEKAAETASNEATEEIEVIPDIIDQLEAKKAAIRQERQDINKELTEYRKLMDQQGGWLPSVTPEQKKAYHEVKQRQKEVNRKLNEVGIEIRKEKAAQKKAAAEQQKPKKKAKPKEKKKTEKPQETEAKEQPKKSKKAEAKETEKKEKPETKKEAPQKEKEAESEPEKAPKKAPKKDAEPETKTELPAIEPYTPSARMRGGDKLRTEKFDRLYKLEKLRDAGVKKVMLGSATVGIETAIKRTQNSLGATSQSEYWEWKKKRDTLIDADINLAKDTRTTGDVDAARNRLVEGNFKYDIASIPRDRADDALLGMVKSHILSTHRDGRTTTVNFKDGRQLVINHITQEAMLTEAGKTGVMYAGRTQGEKGKNVYKAIVDLVDGLNQGNRTLFHEAFHVVWKLFLSNEQISYIKQYCRAKANKGELVRKYVVTRQGTEMALYWTKEQFNALNKERQAEALEEGAAYGFEHWLGSRTDTAPTTMIGKLWQRLADAIRHALVKLNLANQNAKLTDIFHAVASDKLTGQGEQGADNRTKPYVGYSWSVNAQKAKDAGMLTKTELKQKYKYTDAEIELAGADEWHHTSNHYNKTNFYDPDAFKQRLMDAIDSMGFSSLADYRMALKSVPKMVSALAKKHPDIPEPYIKTYYNRLILDNNIFKRRFIEKGGTADGWAYKHVVSLIFGDSYVLNSKVPPRGEEWTAEHEKRENIVNKLLEATGNQTYALNNADQIQVKDHIRYKQIEEKNLVTIHNIPVDSIEKVNSRGGLVMPSIAIIDATKTRFEGFGDASLLTGDEFVNVSAKNPLYTSDAYTPTYPKIYQIVKHDSQLNTLAEYLTKKTGKKVSVWDLDANIEDQGAVQYITSLLYGKLDYRKAQTEAARTLEKYPINIEEKIFAGWTQNGQKRLVPHTAENVIKVMKKESREAPATFWGTSSLRGALAPKFSSLAQAKKNRDMLLSKEEMAPIETDTENKFLAVADKARETRKHIPNQFGYLDIIASDIYDMAKQGWGRIAEFYNGDDIKADYAEFIHHLRNLPTQYFEYKPQRIVGLNEFVGAVVPTGTKASTLKALRDAGIKVYKYEAGDSESRFEVTKKASEELGIRYKPVPTAAEIAEAERQYAEVEAKYKGTDKWLKAPNGKPTNLNERQWVQVRTAAFKAWFGDWENDPANASKVVDENGEPMVVYHGTSSEDELTYFDPELLGTNTGARSAYKGFFFSNNKDVTRGYSTSKKEIVQRMVGLEKRIIPALRKFKYFAQYADNIEKGLTARGNKSVFTGLAGEREWIIGLIDDMLVGDKSHQIEELTQSDTAALTTARDAFARIDEGEVNNVVEVFLSLRNPLVSDHQGKGAWESANGLTQDDKLDNAKDNNNDGLILNNVSDGMSPIDGNNYIAFSPAQIKSATANVGTFDQSNPDIRYKTLNIESPQNTLPKDLPLPADWWNEHIVKRANERMFLVEKEAESYGTQSYVYELRSPDSDRARAKTTYRDYDEEKINPIKTRYDKNIIGFDGEIIDDRYQWLQGNKHLNSQEPNKTAMWRGISAPEMASIINTGKVESLGDMNFDSQQGRTSASQSPSQAVSYASSFAAWYDKPTFDAPAYVLEMSRPDNAEINMVNEIEIVGATPVTAIEKIYEIRVAEEIPGKTIINHEKYGRERLFVSLQSPPLQKYVVRELSKSEWKDINPDIRYRKLTERERAMRDDVWNEIMGRPPTPRVQTRPKVQTEPPEKEPERKSEPQRPQPARPSQSKPPTEAEIDVLSERIGKDLGIAPAQVKEKLGRQMMAAWREAQGDVSRLMESAAIRNFEEWVENNKPEGTDSRDLTWHWEEMLEYAAKVGLSREQIAQMVKSDRFDATAIGINLFQRMNYVGKLLVETEATLADRNWGTPAEREQKEAQYGILQAQFDELQAAYAMQGSEAGTVLWTRRQNKAQYLENLTRAAQALESKINRGSLELAEKRQELDGLERTISDLEKSFEMLLRVMDGKRYKDITEMSNAELEAERQKQAERLNDLRNRAEHLRYEIDQKVAAMQADKGRQEETQTQIRKIRKTGRKAKVIEIKERKPDVHDWIRAAWYNSVLAGIPTHMVNMSANVVNSLLEDVITLFAQGGKVAGAQFAEKVRALFSNYEQLDPKTGEKIKTGAFAKAKEEFTSPQEFSKKNEVILKGNKLFMGIQFSTKFLGAEDMLAFFPNERGMLKSLAFDESKRTGRSVADLMENPTSDMLRQAYYEAKRNTFNQNPEGYVGVLIEAINKFYNALDQSGGGGKAIGNLIRFNVMPFTRVLGNVLNATIDYTPLGMIRYFAYKSDNPNSLLNRQRKDQNGRPLWLDENGDRMVSPFKARDARRQAARVALGTILGSLLYFLTMSADDDDEDKWFISGAGPQDYKKYKQLMAAGWRPFSFHIGNVIISYKEWPVSGAFAVIGNLHDIQKYDGKTRPQDWLDKTIYATMGVASSFLDRSFASNAISTATALDRGDPKWVKRSLTSTTSSTIIPYNNMLRFIENTYNRDLYTPETIAQQAWASVPLVPKKGLPRRVNVFGMYEKKDPATARLAMTDNVGLVVPDTKKTREIFQTVRKNNLFLSETTKREHRVDPYVGKRGIPEEDKQYIWLQGKDHENFRVMRGTEYVRLLNEPQNYNLIMQYDKNKDKDELAALLTSLGRKATAYATEETLKAYQRGELKHKYNTYNKSREEED